MVTRRTLLKLSGGGGIVLVSGCADLAGEASGDDDRDGGDDANGNQTTNGNGEEVEELDFIIDQLEDADLTNTDPTQPGTKDTYTVGVETEAEPETVDIKLRSGSQQNILTQDYNEELEIPLTELLPHQNTITLTSQTDKQKITGETELNVKTPGSYQVEPITDGKTLGPKTDWRYAQNHTDTEKLWERHIEHTNDEWVWTGDVRQIDVGHIPDHVDETDVEQLEQAGTFQDIITHAGRIAADITQEKVGGVNTLGREIAYTARELAKIFHDVEPISMQTDHRNIGSTGGVHGTLHYDPETQQYLFQGFRGENAVPLSEEQWRGWRSYEDTHHPIADFEPGEIEGLNYWQKTGATHGALLNMSVHADTSAEGGAMNDYFLDAATDHMMNDGDIYEVKNWTDAMMNLAETETGYVCLAIDEGEGLEDAELIAMDDDELYDDIVREPEPVSKTEIKQRTGLN